MLIEVFFICNENFHFLPNFEVNKFYTARLSDENAAKKYGAGILNIPSNYQSGYAKSLLKLSGVKNPRPNLKDLDPVYEATNNRSKMPADLRVKLRLTPPNENVLVYDVEYSINAFGRRKVTNQSQKLNAHRYLLALGDSYTFGQGVTSGMDYPSQLAKKLSDNYFVYNFGKPGFAPNDLLFRFQNGIESLDEITQEEGVAVWYFIEAHLERFICGFYCYHHSFDLYVSAKPKYRMIENELKYVGNLADTMTSIDKFLYYSAQIKTLQFAENLLFADYADVDLRAFVESLKKVKAYLEEKKNLKKFYFLHSHNFHQQNRITQLLNEAGIDVINASDLPIKNLQDMKIPFDGHPSSDYYWLISEVVKKVIEP